MAGSTISSTITQTVTLGSATYTSPLMIAHSGLIDPATLSTNVIRADGLFLETVAGIGVLSTIAAPYLDNLGIILGGTAASFTDVGQSIGGYGVFFTSGGTVSNAGTIRGGSGAQFGAGVAINGIGTLINTGLISGGYSRYNGGGGAYVSGSLLNEGTIIGGASNGQAGEGFAGSGELMNNGTILGGNGTIRGEIGVGLESNTTLVNNGVIRAGNGGKFSEIAVYVVGNRANITIINTGLISGGYGSIASGPGVNIAANSLRNSGVIMGGSGPDYAADGVDAFGGASITNSGTFLGGSGNQAGDGFKGIPPNFFVPAIGSDIVNNTGLIRGGSGTIAGDGVYLYVQSSLNNQGTIIGGYGATFGNGVRVESGNVITNGAATDTSALIIGNNGVEIQGTSASSLINFASIVGRHDGVYIQQTVSTTSIIINEATGIIIGNTYGVFITGTPGTVANMGTIRGVLSRGVYIPTGGSVFNIGTTSLIVSGNGNGNDAGVRSNGSAYVMNQGTIRSTYTTGVYLYAGGSINNTGRAAVIEGQLDGVCIYNSAGEVTNSGRISGTDYNGIILGAGTITNEAGGIIIGADFGVDVYQSSGTVINAGTISGGTDAIKLHGTGVNRLIVDAGAVFIGSVTASSSASNFLEFAAETNASTGTLTGIGTQFTGFQTIGFDTGAKWRIEGSISGLGSGETINGFTIGDTIILDGFAATSDTYTSHGLVLGNGTSYVTLDITGSFSTANFDVMDPPAETTITVVCYLRGTKIATPAGERAIETLSIGDAVMTKFGGYRRIKWIGRQSYARRFIAGNFDQIPVRFAAGSLGPNLPKRELFVSPSHSMLIGGVLVLAKSLVNGITVTQYECPEQVDYFQLEFETHDCVLAEGVWAESYADTPGLRAKFHNAAAFYEIYPDHSEPETQSLCAPRPLEGPPLEAALRPLIAQLRVRPGLLHGCIDEISPGLIRGWAWDEANPHLPVLLEILAGGRVIGMILACDYRDDLAQAGIGRGHCSFCFTAPSGALRQGPVTIRRAVDRAEILTPDEYKRKKLGSAAA